MVGLCCEQGCENGNRALAIPMAIEGLAEAIRLGRARLLFGSGWVVKTGRLNNTNGVPQGTPFFTSLFLRTPPNTAIVHPSAQEEAPGRDIESSRFAPDQANPVKNGAKSHGERPPMAVERSTASAPVVSDPAKPIGLAGRDPASRRQKGPLRKGPFFVHELRPRRRLAPRVFFFPQMRLLFKRAFFSPSGSARVAEPDASSERAALSAGASCSAFWISSASRRARQRGISCGVGSSAARAIALRMLSDDAQKFNLSASSQLTSTAMSKADEPSSSTAQQSLNGINASAQAVSSRGPRRDTADMSAVHPWSFRALASLTGKSNRTFSTSPIRAAAIKAVSPVLSANLASHTLNINFTVSTVPCDTACWSNRHCSRSSEPAGMGRGAFAQGSSNLTFSRVPPNNAMPKARRPSLSASSKMGNSNLTASGFFPKAANIKAVWPFLARAKGSDTGSNASIALTWPRCAACIKAVMPSRSGSACFGSTRGRRAVISAKSPSCAA